METEHEEINTAGQFSDLLIELANHGFGLSKDAFLRSVKKFLDKEVGTVPFKDSKTGKWFRSSSIFIPCPLIKLSSSQYTTLI